MSDSNKIAWGITKGFLLIVVIVLSTCFIGCAGCIMVPTILQSNKAVGEAQNQAKSKTGELNSPETTKGDIRSVKLIGVRVERHMSAVGEEVSVINLDIQNTGTVPIRSVRADISPIGGESSPVKNYFVWVEEDYGGPMKPNWIVNEKGLEGFIVFDKRSGSKCTDAVVEIADVEYAY